MDMLSFKQHIYSFTFLLAVLFSSGCDSIVTTDTTIPYSKPPCEVDLAYVKNMENRGETFFTVPDKYNSGSEVTQYNLLELPVRQFKLAIPRTDDVTLHVYSSFPYAYYVRAFAIRGPGELLELSRATRYTAPFQAIDLKVEVDKQYDYILVEVRYDPKGYDGEQLDKEHYIGLTAYDEKPTRHRNFNRRKQPVECDGVTPRCYVLSSCNRNLNLSKWAEELGLEVTDKTNEGFTVNACVPPGFSLDITNPNGETADIERDTTNGTMEVNFTFELSPLLANSFGELLTFSGQNEQNETKREPVIDVLAGRGCFGYQPKNGNNGEIVATIIDSGVSPITAPGIPGWSAYQNTVDMGPYRRAGSLGFDFVNNDTDPNEQTDHGTSVAGALVSNYRGNRRLTLINHKIVDDQGKATYFGAVEAIYAAADHGTDLLNLSWGISQADAPLALGCAIRYALEKGVRVVTTAGNKKTDIDGTPQWPGAFSDDPDYKGLLTIGSYTVRDPDDLKDRERAGFSNFGKSRVDAYAFMMALVPANFGQDTARVFGTSVSAPLLAGYLLSRPALDGIMVPEQFELRRREVGFFNPANLDVTGSAVGDHGVWALPFGCLGRP